MKTGKLKRLTLTAAVLSLTLFAAACGQIKENSDASPSVSPAASGQAGQTAAAQDHKYVIGWSTIYLTPSWMQETNKFLTDRAEYWKSQGVLDKVVVTNANGDTSVQISQIENMISQKYDAILVDAGSATALNPVLEKAVNAGIPVVAFDSLPSTDKITSKVNPDTKEWGSVMAQWLADKLGGKGKVIAMNGPAGVAVSEERWAGAKEVFDQYPDIKIVANLHSEYNEGPAMQAILPALDANPDVDGIFSQGGSMSSAAIKAIQQKNMKLIPVTGENYNGYLKQWNDLLPKGFSSFAPANPNWLSALSLDQAIRALQGYKVEKVVKVKLPTIDDNTLKDYVPNDYPDDYFPIKDLTEDEITQILGPLEK
ncbi:ABC transporter substrate-binding protein [Cohnella caldifontis]|uniref:ABC transporter substrate-binding protein n=1 Tax=Cohnella caldifontis TaxID=3027471 RepID=UPI0023EB0F9A|nr:ABC transporter substrate-binding protein [Cohnella sp. YIM B05605]